MFKRISKYLGETRDELRKATWPWDPREKGFKRYKELTDATIVVFIAMLLLGAYVSTADLILNSVKDLLLR